MPNSNDAGNTATQQAAGAAGAQNGGNAGQPTQPNTNVGGASNNQQPTNQEKKFTQDELDEHINDRLKRQEASFFKKCGVKSQDELDAKLNEANKVKQENVLIKNHIADERYDDVLTHFKGKGQELTNDALVEALKTHPEWLGKKETPQQSQASAPQNGANTTTVKNIGAQQSADHGDDELDFIEKHFGVRPKKVN